MGVDPSVAERPHDECGIVVVYISNTLHLERRFVVRRRLNGYHRRSGQRSPYGQRMSTMRRLWWRPTKGGALVKQVVRLASITSGLPMPPIRETGSSKAKSVRAEPLSAAYAHGRVHHLNVLPELEDQLVSWVAGDSNYSPDRLDALAEVVGAGLFPEADPRPAGQCHHPQRRPPAAFAHPAGRAAARTPVHRREVRMSQPEQEPPPEEDGGSLIPAILAAYGAYLTWRGANWPPTPPACTAAKSACGAPIASQLSRTAPTGERARLGRAGDELLPWTRAAADAGVEAGIRTLAEALIWTDTHSQGDPVTKDANDTGQRAAVPTAAAPPDILAQMVAAATANSAQWAVGMLAGWREGPVGLAARRPGAGDPHRSGRPDDPAGLGLRLPVRRDATVSP